MMYILDERGEPAPCDDVITWAEWYATADRRVAEENVNGVWVSTVFLGIDHNFVEGPPLLWETMVFGGALDRVCCRYATRREALDGHARMLARVTASEEQGPGGEA